MKKNILAAGLIFALTLAAYSNSFVPEFTLDDFHQITENPHVKRISGIPRFFTDAGMGSYRPELKGYRPLTYASFAVNYAASGESVWSYHLLNLLLHFLNALLAYLIIGSVLSRAGVAGSSGLALFISLAFSLHPVETSAVTYISGRAVILAAFFYLLSFYLFLRHRSAAGWKSVFWVLSPLLFILGLLSKEMAVSLPAVMLAYDLIFTVRDRGGLRKSYGIFLFHVPFIAALAGFLAVKKSLQGFVAIPSAPSGVWEYLISQAKALLMYERLILLPVNQNADYYLPLTEYVDAKVAVSALLVVLAFVFIYRVRKRSPAASFFGLWFFLAMAPESSFVPITDIAVEYRLYLPSIGFIAACILIVSGCLRTRARRGMAFLALVLLGVLAFCRNEVWANNYTLWKDVVTKSPYSIRAHANYGRALAAKGDYLDAANELSASLKMDPKGYQGALPLNNLGLCYFKAGMMDEAIGVFRKAIGLDPVLKDPYMNLSMVYSRQGRYADAVGVLREVAGMDPTFTEARLILGKTLMKLGRRKEAIAELDEAAVFKPDDFDVRYALGFAYLEEGMREQALRHARAAVALAGNQAQKGSAESLLARMEGREEAE